MINQHWLWVDDHGGWVKSTWQFTVTGHIWYFLKSNGFVYFKRKKKKKSTQLSMIKKELWVVWYMDVDGCEAWNYYSHLLPWEKTAGERNSQIKKGIARGITKKWKWDLIKIQLISEFWLYEPINPLYCKPIWVGFSATTSEDTLINFQPTTVTVLLLHCPQHVLSQVIKNVIGVNSMEFYETSCLICLSSTLYLPHLQCSLPYAWDSILPCLVFLFSGYSTSGSFAGSPVLGPLVSPLYFPSKWLAVTLFITMYVSHPKDLLNSTYEFLRPNAHTTILDIPQTPCCSLHIHTTWLSSIIPFLSKQKQS